MTLTELNYNTGAAWTDLLGTVSRPYGPKPYDRLTDVDRLHEWLDHVGLSPRGTNDAAARDPMAHDPVAHDPGVAPLGSGGPGKGIAGGCGPEFRGSGLVGPGLGASEIGSRAHGTGVDDHGLRSTVLVREALRRVVNDALMMPRTSDAPAAEQAAALLNEVTDAISVPFTAAGSPVLRPTSLADALGRVVVAAATDLADPSGLRACADPDCAKLYRDSSGSRRFCGPECATRLRVRAHRGRAHAQ